MRIFQCFQFFFELFFDFFQKLLLLFNFFDLHFAWLNKFLQGDVVPDNIFNVVIHKLYKNIMFKFSISLSSREALGLHPDISFLFFALRFFYFCSRNHCFLSFVCSFLLHCPLLDSYFIFLFSLNCILQWNYPFHFCCCCYSSFERLDFAVWPYWLFQNNLQFHLSYTLIMEQFSILCNFLSLECTNSIIPSFFSPLLQSWAFALLPPFAQAIVCSL